jgi:hypothetical protein
MREAAKLTFLVIGSSVVLFLTLVVVLLIILIKNFPEEKAKLSDQDNKTVSSQKLIGVSFSPKSNGIADSINFYSEAQSVADTITWAGSWAELSNENAGPYTIGKTAKEKGFQYIALVGTHQGGSVLKPHKELTEVTKNEYINSSVTFVEEFQLDYFVMGVEVDRIFEQDPAGFDFYVDLFEKASREIRKTSPNTKKVVVFQLEKLKGLHGGLFGGVNDLTKSQWILLDKFPSADVIGFTTYPGLIYKHPSEIPSDYYSEIGTRTTKPVIFTEIGWSSGDDNIPGWESSQDEQAEFVSRFFKLTEPLDPKVLIWPFLFDNNYGQPFNNIGLINEDGVRKKAWETWRSYLK